MTYFEEHPDNRIYGSFGEFDSFDETANWTAEDWAAYDSQVAAEIEEFDREQEMLATFDYFEEGDSFGTASDPYLTGELDLDPPF